MTQNNKIIVIILLLISFLLFTKVAISISLLILLFVSEILLVYVFANKNIKTIKLFTYIIIFQNTVLILSTNFISKQQFNILLLIKELYLCLTLIFLPNIYLKKIRINNADKVALLILIYTGLLFFISPYPIMAKLANARELISLILLYLFGRSIYLSKSNINNYFKFLINIAILISLFGFLEISLGDKLWANIGIEKFMEYKGMEKWAYASGGLPGNFYTFDFYNIIGKSIRRLVSFIAEPTTTGQFLVVPLVFLVFNKKLNIRFKNSKIIVILLAIFMGLGKGAILILFIAITYCIKHILGYKKVANTLYFSIFMIASLVIVYSLINHTSVSIHFNGLIENIVNLPRNLLGNGIGSTGNFALLYGESTMEVGSGESFFGVLVGQLGAVGVILYSIFIKSIMNKLNQILMFHEELRDEVIISKGLFIGTILASFLSQSVMGFIAISLYMIIIGVFITAYDKDKKIKN